jgi:hypothetical protein
LRGHERIVRAGTPVAAHHGDDHALRRHVAGQNLVLEGTGS